MRHTFATPSPHPRHTLATPSELRLGRRGDAAPVRFEPNRPSLSVGRQLHWSFLIMLFDVGAYLASGLGCYGGVDTLGWSSVA